MPLNDRDPRLLLGAATPSPGVPVWFTIAVGIAAPLLVLLGVLVGEFLTRKGARELDFRAKREEALRNVRWAAEMAFDKTGAAAVMGVAVLGTAKGDPVLQTHSDKALIKAILDSIVEPAAAAYYGRVGSAAPPHVTVAAQPPSSPDDSDDRGEGAGDGGAAST